MTGHPEAIRPSLGEFETCPDWVPAMDTGQRSARISLKTVHVHAFEHNAKSVAKVRNVSRLGSQFLPFHRFAFCAKEAAGGLRPFLWRDKTSERAGPPIPA